MEKLHAVKHSAAEATEADFARIAQDAERMRKEKEAKQPSRKKSPP
eukprot:COSAG05_NODE_66_length_22253_cov_14.954455_2_plen_46_part_00